MGLDYHSKYVEIEEKFLEKINRKFQRSYPRDMIKDVEISHMVNDLIDSVNFNISMDFVGKTEQKEYSARFKFPINWREHLKKSIAPKWFLKRFPVKYKTHYKYIKVNHVGVLEDFAHDFKDNNIFYYSEKII